MLTPQLRSQFVTKVLTSSNGEKYKVVFLVALVNGEVKAQVVSAVLISEKAEAVCLPAPVSKKEIFYSYIPTFVPVVSPFNSLFFFNSQPTRAPSFAY